MAIERHNLHRSWYGASPPLISTNRTGSLSVQNISIQGWEAVREFYTKAYEALPTFRISNARISGPTPEFTVCEMRCEGEAREDVPYLGLKAGDTLRMTGVSLFWWRWEGNGDEWDGSLSEDQIRGWKIIDEHAYYLPVKA